jgi:hypothetical protein
MWNFPRKGIIFFFYLPTFKLRKIVNVSFLQSEIAIALMPRFPKNK